MGVFGYMIGYARVIGCIRDVYYASGNKDISVYTSGNGVIPNDIGFGAPLPES